MRGFRGIPALNSAAGVPDCGLFLDALVPGGPALGQEMLFEERAMEPLDEAVRLGSVCRPWWCGTRSPRAGEREFVGVLVGPAVTGIFEV